MEQQSVTVAKSGVLCSLPARTSILAAANPIGGQYNKSKTVTENLNISQPLLSRFDLIFLLLDKPNKVSNRVQPEQISYNVRTSMYMYRMIVCVCNDTISLFATAL